MNQFEKIFEIFIFNIMIDYRITNIKMILKEKKDCFFYLKEQLFLIFFDMRLQILKQFIVVIINIQQIGVFVLIGLYVVNYQFFGICFQYRFIVEEMVSVFQFRLFCFFFLGINGVIENFFYYRFFRVFFFYVS